LTALLKLKPKKNQLLHEKKPTGKTKKRAMEQWTATGFFYCVFSIAPLPRNKKASPFRAGFFIITGGADEARTQPLPTRL
jgi:hypothetical protein